MTQYRGADSIDTFNIIYADPPWNYRRGGNGSARKHYPLMSVSEICALPVQTLTAPDCVLFLWVTFPILPDVFKVIEAWGFSYKSVAFVWVKPNKNKEGWFYGMGNWTRANAEICLLATKGTPKREARNIQQIISEPRREHSRKPDVTRERIIQLCGDLPRVELFARETPPGWAVWGNQVQSTISL